MRMAVEQLDAERGVLLLADAQTGNLVSVVEHGAVDAATRDQAMGYSRRVVERVARSGGSLLIGDAPSDPEVLSDSMVDLGLRSIVCVPLYLSGSVVGAVYLDDSRRPDTFSDEDRGLLEGFAHLVAVAIEKSRGHEEVRRANEQLVGENLSLRREVGVRFQPQNFIGQSPIFAFGNSDGDLQMLEWTAAGGGARFMALVHHDDAECEWAYDRKSPIGTLDKAWDEAIAKGWIVLSMKDHWKTIFPPTGTKQ